MTYVPTTQQIGIQPIAVSSTVKNHSLGKIIAAEDATYGGGEFIYLLGCASTVAGSVVTYGGASTGVPTYQTALSGTTVHLGDSLAVAMSANVAGDYGWYQIAGAAVVATNGTLTAGASVYLAGSGQLTSTQANGLQVEGAFSVTATGTPSVGLAVVEINRPSAQGQIV